MPQQTRAQLIDQLNFRLANETRLGAEKFWDDTDLHACITAALLKAEPLGDPAIVEVSRLGYLTSPQVPGVDVVAIREVQVVANTNASGDPAVTRLGPNMWRLYRNSPQWLWLNNPPSGTDTVRVHCVKAYDLTETGSTPVVADSEMVICFAMATAYQRFLQNGQVAGQHGEYDLMLKYEQDAQIRRQQLLFVLYPETNMEPPKGKK